MTNRVLRGVLLSGWLFLAVAPAFGQAAGTPESAAVKICSSCHGMQMVTDTPRDYDAWHDTVQKMIDRGARGTPEEFDLVMDFQKNVATFSKPEQRGTAADSTPPH